MKNQKSLSVAEQVASLKHRGMLLDETVAFDIFSKVSYFRLKPYWWDMRDLDTEERLPSPFKFYSRNPTL